MIAKRLLAAGCALALSAGSASAALVGVESFFGNFGLSTDGFGSTTNSGTISASVDAGSTVAAAYLYTATYGNSSPGGFVPDDVELAGTTVSYDPFVENTTACCNIGSARADVTSVVKPIIEGGPGGVYDFEVVENQAQNTSNGIDGHALVVVYENPALPEASIGIFDGFAEVGGDTTTINFAEALDTSNTDFFAEMVLGIGFSCCNQRSTVEVNGELLTENAGNFNDGNAQSNGSLITVGSFDDPISPPLPSYAEDTERYDLTPFIEDGDTSITIDTFNASRDDNIFLATFFADGRAGFNAPPPPPVDPPTNPIPLPAPFMLLASGMVTLGAMRVKRR